jgi:Pyridoxamine-phosphate oxidase
MWLEQAGASGLKEPTAMTVATIDLDGYPDARMLLLKGVDERGFVFFTNMESPKAQSLLRDRAQHSAFIGCRSTSRSACADTPK